MQLFLFSSATELLEQVIMFKKPVDLLLSPFFKARPNLGKNDRKLVTDMVYLTVRHFEEVQVAFELAKPEYALRLALVLALWLDQHQLFDEAKSLLNQTEQDLLTQCCQYDFVAINMQAKLPMWIIEKLQPIYSKEEIIALGQSLNTPAPFDVRVNTLKAKRSNVLEHLKSEGYDVTPTPYAQHGIRFHKKVLLHNHPLFLDGTLEIQDEGSQILAQLSGVKRGQIVVDFCAGAGGKALAMGAMMRNHGRIYVMDIDRHRLNALNPRLVKSGLNIITSLVIDDENDPRLQRLHGKCDVVFVDAPCSGLGTLRRQPDLKYRYNATDIAHFVEQQQKILQSASHLVCSGGRLVYATCSILPEENQNQITDFIEKNPEFIAVEQDIVPSINTKQSIHGTMLTFSPLYHDTDGFFVTVLHKKS